MSLADATQKNFLDLADQMLTGAKVCLRLAEAWGMAHRVEDLRKEVWSWREKWASSTITSVKSVPSVSAPKPPSS